MIPWAVSISVKPASYAHWNEPLMGVRGVARTHSLFFSHLSSTQQFSLVAFSVVNFEANQFPQPFEEVNRVSKAGV